MQATSGCQPLIDLFHVKRFCYIRRSRLAACPEALNTLDMQQPEVLIENLKTIRFASGYCGVHRQDASFPMQSLKWDWRHPRSGPIRPFCSWRSTAITTRIFSRAGGKPENGVAKKNEARRSQESRERFLFPFRQEEQSSRQHPKTLAHADRKDRAKPYVLVSRLTAAAPYSAGRPQLNRNRSNGKCGPHTDTLPERACAAQHASIPDCI